ncbi:MAG: type II toxin-antitoxin system HicB family antitoxin [Lachnospiraceae bacterium]|nr:type II toxin-antitoxin system HicB family antitoxin [Lachnospiraceae bacterium]MDD6578551.1 type II toxin-antitoxin system HicB family antitoxin [Lachnospiraceae bacterium]
MDKINSYMKKNYRMEVFEDHEEGGFTISFPDLPGCLTCAQTLDEAYANAIDAKRGWFEAAIADGIDIPEPKDISKYCEGRCKKI